MKHKNTTLGDNPMRAYFKTSTGRIIRVLCWDNYEPCETGGGAPRSWMILRKNARGRRRGLGLRGVNYPQDWLDKLAAELLENKAVLFA